MFIYILAVLAILSSNVSAQGSGRFPPDSIKRDSVLVFLNQVVVTATRRAQKLKDVPITTEVISRAEIDRTGSSDLAGVLTEQLGMELQGGVPGGTGVAMQGMGAQRVLLLLDGYPLAGRIAGVFDVSRIPTSIIERIEIVKGAQSTLYGSDAMGGVINIITHSSTRDQFSGRISATVGSEGRRDGMIGLSMGRGSVSSSLDLNRRATQTASGQASERDALSRQSDAAFEVNWEPTDNLMLEGSVLRLNERQRSFTGTLYDFLNNKQWTGRLAGTWIHGRHRLSPTLFASVYDHLNHAAILPWPIPGDPGQRQIQGVYQGEILYNGSIKQHAIDVGALVRRDAIRTDRLNGGLHSLTTVEPFTQVQLVLSPSLTLLPGIRISRNQQWGVHSTPRVAARYQAGENITLRASVSTGYRAPDFKELYMFFQHARYGYSVSGNPDLRPEASRNYTVSTEWSNDRTFLRSQLYWNEFHNFIEARLVSPPGQPMVFQYGNIYNGFTRGLETEGGTTIRALHLEASYSSLNTRDRSTDNSLLGYPARSGRIALTYVLPRGVHFSTTSIYTGRTPMQRDAITGAITSWRDSFMRFDSRISHRCARNTELAMGVDNLFNQRPLLWAGFTGRRVYTSIAWNYAH